MLQYSHMAVSAAALRPALALEIDSLLTFSSTRATSSRSADPGGVLFSCAGWVWRSASTRMCHRFAGAPQISRAGDSRAA